MRLIRAVVAAACVGLTSLLIAANTKAQQSGGVTIESIKKSGTLRVGTWLQYKPEMWKDLQTGEIKGFWVEIARKLASDLGVQVEFIDSDWDGLIPGLQAGKFDIVLAQMAITSKRALAVDFAKPWEALGLCAVLPADSSCDTVDCLNQPDKTIATVIGTAAQEVIKSLFPKAQEMANRVNNDGFLQVRTRRSHAYLTDNITAQAYLKEHPGAVKIVWSGVDKPFLQAFPAAPALPKGSLHFARWLDIWFQEQIHNGTYERLYIQNIGWAPPLDVLLLQRGGYP